MSSQSHGGVLLVDDDVLAARGLARELTLYGWDVRVVSSATEALAALSEQASEAIVIDLHMPDMDGVSLIEKLHAHRASSVLCLLSGHVTVATAVRALRVGAHDVFEKPMSGGVLDMHLRSLVPARPANESTASHASATDAILGDALSIRAVRDQIRTVARYRDLPVLICGETGTGKELVAQAVHASSETDGPFVPVNCAALPEQLFESELFGHEAGAFTGARGTRAGLFEVAARGTLFLDEVGELPGALQPKLLRALETRSFRRVGGSRDIPFRARLISATHRRLVGIDSTIRSDLYYRLSGFTITTPSLRDRTSDLDMLANHFLADFSTRYGVRLEFSPRALEALHAHAWPGNVRELRAVVQQAAVLTEGARVGVAELTAALRVRKEPSRAPEQSHTALLPVTVSPPRQPLRELEKRTILESWEASGQNLSAAARLLGLPRTTLRDRLRKYGLLGS